MARGEKLLERMRRNPRDWRIEDVGTLCGAFGIDFDRPTGGSHYGISHPKQDLHLTIPSARPIKPVYIRKLVNFVDAVVAATNESDGMNMPGTYKVVIEPLSQEDGGGFLASVPELPGCISDGETRVEALHNVEDAIATWIHAARKMGRTIPKPRLHRAA